MSQQVLRDKHNTVTSTKLFYINVLIIIIIIIIIIITLFHEGNIIKLYNLFTIWPSITKKTRTTNIVKHAHKIKQINEIIFMRSFKSRK